MMLAAMAVDSHHVVCRYCGWPVATRMPNGWLDPHGLVGSDDRDNLVIICRNPACGRHTRIRKTRLDGNRQVG